MLDEKRVNLNLVVRNLTPKQAAVLARHLRWHISPFVNTGTGRECERRAERRQGKEKRGYIRVSGQFRRGYQPPGGKWSGHVERRTNERRSDARSTET